MNEELYIKYHTKLLRWCMIKTNNYLDAEDLCQEINYQLIKAFSRDAIIIDEERFIWKIAYYTWCKKVRDYEKNKRTISLTDSLENTIKDEDEDILKKVEQDELKEILSKYIESMNDKIKNCMILYYFNDLSIKEIALKLNIKESLVKYYLYQGRDKLRKELENEKF